MSGVEPFTRILPLQDLFLRTKSMLTLGDDVFYVSECKGEGGFAKVFAASKQETEGDCLCSKS